MSVTIVITKTLDGTWFNDEEAAQLDDEEIVELVREDVFELLDGATWEVKRD